MITLQHFMVLSCILFTIGFLGVIINLHNIIVILLSIEIMLLATNILFVSLSYFLKNLDGQILSMFILGVSAAEAAIALSIAMLYFKKKQTVSLQLDERMKG